MINTENKFEYNGLIYIAVEESSCSCRLCDFNDENKCSAPDAPVAPPCDSYGRTDNRSVCFVLSDIDNEGKEQ